MAQYKRKDFAHYFNTSNAKEMKEAGAVALIDDLMELPHVLKQL